MASVCPMVLGTCQNRRQLKQPTHLHTRCSWTPRCSQSANGSQSAQARDNRRTTQREWVPARSTRRATLPGSPPGPGHNTPKRRLSLEKPAAWPRSKQTACLASPVRRSLTSDVAAASSPASRARTCMLRDRFQAASKRRA
jgi:hypothetical protein